MGAAQAITDLGLEKTAFIGGLLARPVAWLGGKILGGAARLGASPRTLQTLQTIGKGVPREAAGFGLLGGGIGALTAEEGHRGEGFARGLAGGMLGGVGWGLGKNLASMGLQRGLGQAGYGALQRAAGPVQNVRSLNPFSRKRVDRTLWFGGFGQGAGQGMRQFGANLALKGVPLAGAFAGSAMMPTLDREPGAPQTWGGAAQQQVANYGQPQYAGYTPYGAGY